jgi:hypothetical protein
MEILFCGFSPKKRLKWKAQPAGERPKKHYFKLLRTQITSFKPFSFF